MPHRRHCCSPRSHAACCYGWSFLPTHATGWDFTEATAVMRSPTGLPILQIFCNLANFHFTHAGRMRLLGWAYAGGAAVSAASVAWLGAPAWSVGAVAATYSAEVATIATLTIWCRAEGEA